MPPKKGAKIAFTVLFGHGIIELTGAATLLLAPTRLISIFFPTDLVSMLEICCLGFGLPRSMAGYAIWSGRKWGIVFGTGLSIVTIIVSPILVFDIVKPPLAGTVLALALDLPLALVVLASSLYVGLSPMTHIEKSYEVKATPEEVFGFLDDISRRGEHMMGMGKKFTFEILSENKKGLGAKYHWRGSTFGWSFEWTELVTRWVENKERATQSIEGMKMDLSWKLTPIDHGTMVSVTMDYELGSSWFSRFIDLVFARRYCSKGLDSDYAHMKMVLEKEKLEHVTVA